jgi:Recombination endonuclease VII
MPRKRTTAEEKLAVRKKYRLSERHMVLHNANSRKRYNEDHARQRKIKNEYRLKNLGKLRKYHKYYSRQNRYSAEPTRKCPSNCECCNVSFGTAMSFQGACFDHDHTTNAFRGWLCRRCNIALGSAGDNKEGLQQLLRYLDKVELLS